MNACVIKGIFVLANFIFIDRGFGWVWVSISGHLINIHIFSLLYLFIQFRFVWFIKFKTIIQK